ncbi:RNA polymerase sigma factor [Candidatus Latescibacterota bacterium]
MAESRAADRALVDRARDGDESAFRELVEKYESQVAATAIGMLGPGPDAEDVGQETFVRFYGALDKFRGEASVGTYVTRIAINLSLNASKRRQRSRLRFWSRDRAEDPPPEPSVDGQAVVDGAARDELVREAIQRLKPEHRAVVVLRMLEGHSTRETAELLDIPEGTVLSRLSRGMTRLKSILVTGMEDEDEA